MSPPVEPHNQVQIRIFFSLSSLPPLLQCVSAISTISISVTCPQSNPPCGCTGIGSLAGMKSKRYGCSRSTDSWPLRLPVNSWHLAGGKREILPRFSAALSSIIRCISLPPRLAPNSLIASALFEHTFWSFLFLKNIRILRTNLNFY